MFCWKAPIFQRFFVSVLFLFAFGLVLSIENARASTIAGFVYDQQRNPLQDVDVELLNEDYFVRARTKTNSIGRYQFSNLGDGRYYVRVLPFRFNLQDQTQEIIINTISLLGTGNMNYEQDFYLARKKGDLNDTDTGVVYVQEVPKEAEALYKQADDDFSDKKLTEGAKKLIAAIKIFPNYYAASQRLGIELLKNKQYLDAVKFFARAAEINPKSSRSFYYMGFSLNSLGADYNKAALKALEKAYILAPASWEVAYLIGKIERQEGNFRESEKYLLKSKKLADARVPDIHIELAQLYGNELKEYAKAADELELYMKSSNKNDEEIKKKINDLRRKAKENS